MISVEGAKKLVTQHTEVLPSIEIKLAEGLGYVLSEDVYAPISHPPFEQSAMDGYAIGQFSKNIPFNTFKLVGETKAGDLSTFSLKEGEAIRIFTGAMVPCGAMSVIMQEATEVIGDELIIHQEIKAGSNIRPEGNQIKVGQLALPKGTALSPAGLGFLADLGITQLKVYAKPKVSLIVTGNELVKAGQELQKGQIYESNSTTLTAALLATGINVASTKLVQDSLEQTTLTIQKMMESMEVIIISGGISVGDYDFVGEALKNLNVEEVFYKVNQKPGKPLFFGKKGKCLIFALPGNPSAALLCYYQYVMPTIRKMCGKSVHSLEKRNLVLKNGYIKKGDRAHFLKAKVEGETVEILEGQSSAVLYTFAVANALVYIPGNKDEVQKGELVEVQMLP